MDQNITSRIEDQEPPLAAVAARYDQLRVQFGDSARWKDLSTAQKEAIVENAYADDPVFWDAYYAADS